MGLDMYLSRRTYVKRWSHQAPLEQFEVSVLRGGEQYTGIDPAKVTYVTEEVAYWRKANHIHKWFVDNCQGGVDQCQESDVTLDQLEELLELCRRVLREIEVTDGEVYAGTTYYAGGRAVDNVAPGKVIVNKELAHSLLPTQDGFFFGGTDYDENYIADLEDTVRFLDPLLALHATDDLSDAVVSYTYRASW